MRYLVSWALERAAVMYLFLPVPRVVNLFHLRQRNVGLYTSRSSFADAKLVTLARYDCIDLVLLYVQFLRAIRRSTVGDRPMLSPSAWSYAWAFMRLLANIVDGWSGITSRSPLAHKTDCLCTTPLCSETIRHPDAKARAVQAPRASERLLCVCILAFSYVFRNRVTPRYTQ